MVRVLGLMALVMSAISAPASAQYYGPGHEGPETEKPSGLTRLLSSFELEGGFETSSSNLIDGQTVPSSVTIEARDVSDSHDGAQRIALRGVRDSGGPVEMSFAISHTTASAKAAVAVGTAGADAILATFGDYEKLGFEFGVRRYFGDRYATLSGSRLRSFYAGSIGLAHVKAMDVVLQSAGFGGLGFANTITSGLYDDSWVPTASVSAGLHYRVTKEWAIEGEVGARYDAAADGNDQDLSLLGLGEINDTQGRMSYPFLLRARFTL